MDRRLFLKLTGLAAAASAIDASSVAAQALETAPAKHADVLQPPGLYQFNGRVRLDAAVVEITGISNAQQISWSGAASGFGPISASFSSYEQFDAPWRMPDVKVAGGRLESLAIVPVVFA
jgi:hypothetical protein